MAVVKSLSGTAFESCLVGDSTRSFLFLAFRVSPAIAAEHAGVFTLERWQSVLDHRCGIDQDSKQVG